MEKITSHMDIHNNDLKQINVKNYLAQSRRDKNAATSSNYKKCSRLVQCERC